MSARSWFPADLKILWEPDSGKDKTANSWESAFPVGDVLSGLGVYDNPVGTGDMKKRPEKMAENLVKAMPAELETLFKKLELL